MNITISEIRPRGDDLFAFWVPRWWWYYVAAVSGRRKWLPSTPLASSRLRCRDIAYQATAKIRVRAFDAMLRADGREATVRLLCHTIISIASSDIYDVRATHISLFIDVILYHSSRHVSSIVYGPHICRVYHQLPHSRALHNLRPTPNSSHIVDRFTASLFISALRIC